VAIFDSNPLRRTIWSCAPKLPLWAQLCIVLGIAIGVFIVVAKWGLTHPEGGLLVIGLGLIFALAIAAGGWACVMYLDEIRQRKHE
jgi:hypothetical protein